MKGIIIASLAVVLFISGGTMSVMSASAGEDTITFTILYDNYKHAEGTKPDWGFSCLIEGMEKTILFDTGTNPDILLHNVEQMGIDLKKIDVIVISHDHGDHTGGLEAVLNLNPRPPVYIPAGVNPQFLKGLKAKKDDVIEVTSSIPVCDSVLSTGVMGESIKEQSLILQTSEGLIIVTGCSHQGIVNILKRAKEITSEDILLVFGGFHLMQHSESQLENIINSFKELGVVKCGATHCTGDNAIQMFKDAFGENYVPIGTGNVLKMKK